MVLIHFELVTYETIVTTRLLPLGNPALPQTRQLKPNSLPLPYAPPTQATPPSCMYIVSVLSQTVGAMQEEDGIK